MEKGGETHKTWRGGPVVPRFVAPMTRWPREHGRPYYLWAMILALNTFGKEPHHLDVEAESAEFPELTEIGVVGKMGLHVDVTPLAGDSHLVQGEVAGRLSVECGRCLEPFEQAFSTRFNLLLDRKDSTGVAWVEDEDQGVEDYQAHLGPDVTEIPLQSVIVEQLLLNYNFHPLPELDAAGCCVQCGRPAPTAQLPKKAEGVDPRWAKLENLKGESPVNGSAKPGSKKKN